MNPSLPEQWEFVRRVNLVHTIIEHDLSCNLKRIHDEYVIFEKSVKRSVYFLGSIALKRCVFC